MKNSSFAIVSRAIANPWILLAIVLVGNALKARSGFGMLPDQEIFASLVFGGVGTVMFFLKLDRESGPKTKLFCHYALSFCTAGLCLWSVLATFFAWGNSWTISDDIRHDPQQRAGYSNVWTVVRTRESPEGRIVTTKPSGLFLKPCVAGCVEDVSLHDEKVTTRATFGVYGKKEDTVLVSGRLLVGNDDALLSALVLREEDPQDALRQMAAHALADCATMLKGVVWPEGRKTDIHLGCPAVSQYFTLEKVVVTHPSF